MITRLLIITLLLVPISRLVAQSVNSTKETRTAAQLELETVILEAKNLDSKIAIVNIRARGAMLLSYYDPKRSQELFLEVWKFVNDQTDRDIDKPQARLLILKSLFPRNSKLAKQLLAEQSNVDSGSPSSATSRLDDDRFTGRLASQLVDTDPSAAASLLEKSLTTSVTPANIGALTRLREKNSVLTDYIATKALDSLPSQPTRMSLPGVHIMTAYAFPGPEVVVNSVDAESSLQLLQFKYFLAGYEVLKGSLRETNEMLLKDLGYTPRDVQVRAAFQGQVAAILAALAPRFHPSLTGELTNIATKLAPHVPPQMAQVTKFALARLSGNRFESDDPEQKFMFALLDGDFDEASSQLDHINDDKKKTAYFMLLNKNQAKALLAKSEIMDALSAIRKIEDPTTRLILYLDALRASKKQSDNDLTNLIINEARHLVPQTEKNGLHVRAVLLFIAYLSKSETASAVMQFLNSAVVSINGMVKKNAEQGGNKSPADIVMAELNDPNSLLDATEMEQAFSSVGLINLDAGLAQAKRIEVPAVQLMARLETVQGVIQRGSVAPKVPASRSKVSSSPER